MVHGQLLLMHILAALNVIAKEIKQDKVKCMKLQTCCALYSERRIIMTQKAKDIMFSSTSLASDESGKLINAIKCH